MKTIRTAATVAILMAVVASQALLQTAKAAPARTSLTAAYLTDRTPIYIQLLGDEWNHWIADTNGRRLIQVADSTYRYTTAEEDAEWQAQWQDNPHRPTRSVGMASHYSFPTRGEVRGLVVLVEYQDVRFNHDIYGDPLQQYSDMMNLKGYNYASGNYVHVGSAHDYFYQNSMGLFNPHFDVYGPILLKNNRSHYGENAGNSDKRPHEMIIEACQQLDEQGVDFSLYDNDGNGEIDFVFAIYAGVGENVSGSPADCVWPHAWNLSSVSLHHKHSFDGLYLESYACTNELYQNQLDGVGTFCHEFCHVLGLPDLYNTENASSTNSPYNYSILDSGCYRNRGYCPIALSAYERYELGWIEPEILPCEAATVTIPDLLTSNKAYILPVSSGADEDPRNGELYVFENRQQHGWDSSLPGHGMLVWHTDYVRSKWTHHTNKVNTWVNHQCVDLIEADGPKRNSSGSFTSDGSMPFPGTKNHTEFTDDTTPAFRGWTNPGSNDASLDHRLFLPITNIREVEQPGSLSLICFDILGGDAAIQSISNDASPSLSQSELGWRDGRFCISINARSYDLQGRLIGQ